MLRPIWTYCALGEIARVVEPIDVLIECGTAPGPAAKDAARIYRQRIGDDRTPSERFQAKCLHFATRKSRQIKRLEYFR